MQKVKTQKGKVTLVFKKTDPYNRFAKTPQFVVVDEGKARLSKAKSNRLQAFPEDNIKAGRQTSQPRLTVAVESLPEKTLGFQPRETYKDFVLKELEFSLKKLKRFFKLPFFPIKVFLAYSRKEFDNFIGRKTALWEVGSANCPKNEVCLLSPLIFEKESTHKKGDFPRVLTHELAHLFTYRLYPFYEPRWLREGLAYFIAGQGKPDFRQRVNLLVSNGDFLSRIDTAKSWRENLYHGAYHLSFLWVSFLIKKFGKERMLELFKKINFPYEKKKFDEVFIQVYRQDLDSLQKEFIKNYFSRSSKRKGGENKNDSRI